MTGNDNPLPSRQAGIAARVWRWSNKHSVLFFALLSAWYVALVWKLAVRPLWFDELTTFYIASQPTVARMQEAIRTVDLNPPLNYFLTRWSIGIFGATPWATRIPALLAFWGGSAAIFAILRRRSTSLLAAIGVLLFWSSPYFSYAAEARPYGLLLGLTALLLWAWDPAATNRPASRYVIVAVVGTLLLLSHAFGLLSLGAAWIGEAVGSWRRRRLHWPMVAALLVPLVATLTWKAMFHTMQGATFSPEAQVTWGKLGFLYYAVFRWMWRPLLLLLIVAVSAKRRRRQKMTGAGDVELGFVRATSDKLPVRYARYLPETIAVLGLLFLTPVAITIVFLRSHGAFYDRYGMAMVIPIALAATVLPSRWIFASPRFSFLAFCGVGILLLLSTTLRDPIVHAAQRILPPRAATKVTGMVMTSPHGPFRPWWKKLAVPPQLLTEREHAPLIHSLDQFYPELPLVAASELTFVELDHRESVSVTSRLSYLYDRHAEAEISHRPVADTMFKLKNFFPLRGQLQPYQSFIGERRQFLVIGQYEHSGDWLLRKLEIDGATLAVVARMSDNEQNDIYLVTLRAS